MTKAQEQKRARRAKRKKRHKDDVPFVVKAARHSKPQALSFHNTNLGVAPPVGAPGGLIDCG